MTHRVEENAVFTGSVTIASGSLSTQPRSFLTQDTVKRFPIPLHSFRIWDALATNLSGTASSDDLGITTGTFASAPIRITAGDLKAAGATTRRARNPLVPIPECYDAAETFQIVVGCGMATSVADTSCFIDIECCRVGKDGTVGADICATAQQSMNSLTFAEKTFTITATSLTPGDALDIRVSVICTDAATGTAVTPEIASVDIACDIKG